MTQVGAAAQGESCLSIALCTCECKVQLLLLKDLERLLFIYGVKKNDWLFTMLLRLKIAAGNY